jgi:predicted peptidase
MGAALPHEPGLYGLVCTGTGGRFTLSIPPGSDGSPVPLIIVLHWGGQVTPFYGRSILSGLAAPALGELGAMMAAPDCLRDGWDNPQSESDVLKLVSYLEEHYKVDPYKNLIMGYSMGGIGVWHFVTRYPKRFTAGIALAAPAASEYLALARRVPMFVIHSRQDEYFPFEGTEQAVLQLIDQGAPVEFMPVEGATHFNTENLIKPLQNTLPWIQEIWQKKEYNNDG